MQVANRNITAILKAFALALSIYSPQSSSGDYLLAGSLSMHAIDWMQSREIAKNDKFIELNPILGKNPSLEYVDAYFLITGLAFIKINSMLSKRHRKFLNIGYIAWESTYVLNNYSIGVKIRF